MAHVRRLPSGKWQAEIRLPSGKRTTYTAALKGEVKAWADSQEAKIRRGEWQDPRIGRVTYDEWRDRWCAARVIEPETRRSDESMLVNHVDKHWSGQLLPAIGRLDVQGWVRKLEKDGVGAHAIRRAYNLLSTMLSAAVLEGVISVSPCRKIDLPATPPKAPAWFTPAQVHALLLALPERHATAVALMCWTGLRWGEMAGLRIGDVAWERRRVQVVGARTQAGAWKEYPKSSKSRREVPVPPAVMVMLDRERRGRPDDAPLFVTVRGGRPWSASNWRKVWDEAVAAAGVPDYPPHTCRHTAASWLVQGGVDLYRVQALLGHESHSTTERYSHLQANHYDPIEAVWEVVAPPPVGLPEIEGVVVEEPDDDEAA